MLPQRLTVNLSAFQCGGAVKSARLVSVNASLRSKKANVAVVLALDRDESLIGEGGRGQFDVATLAIEFEHSVSRFRFAIACNRSGDNQASLFRMGRFKAFPNRRG